MKEITNEREFLKKLKALDDELNELWSYCTYAKPTNLMMGFVYEVCNIVDRYKDQHGIDELLEYMEVNDNE